MHQMCAVAASDVTGLNHFDCHRMLPERLSRSGMQYVHGLLSVVASSRVRESRYRCVACVQVAALLEERLNQGVNFLLSGEIDHWKKVKLSGAL